MAYWLARKREGQDTATIQRFDPRFWTVDFPRPMMASVVTTGPASLRVDCEFHHRDALAGLIWASEDRFDHPLLSYDTNRNYAHTHLRFRWRSAGVIPLDGVNGPTLTIEGRDARGAPRIWYVRIWNYAAGTPEDAQIAIAFSDLRDGFEADGARVYPGDIDRMFLSLTPPGFAAEEHIELPARADGWVELSDIACDGAGAILPIGDVVLPDHGLGICTAYDDSYHLTPARMLRNALHLGYRGELIHYVGMSHYFRLRPDVQGTLLADADVPLCTPCIRWHAAFFAECALLGMPPIVSLSMELFNAHCPESWKQRDRDGNPALTGWVPPSSLISPLSVDGFAYLRAVSVAFLTLAENAGVPLSFQVGEPWWWVNRDGRPCIYDDHVRAAYADLPGITDLPDITDLTVPYSGAAGAFLDWCALQLALAIRQLGRWADDAFAGRVRTHMLMFTPTLLDPARPAITQMNVDHARMFDAFDVLQVEDYDWLTEGAEALARNAWNGLIANSGHAVTDQHYLGGFVLLATDAEPFWARIDRGLDAALGRGVARAFVWALPQIVRDGYVRLPLRHRTHSPDPETDMQAFDDVLYPLALGRDAGVSPEFSTRIALTASGHERRGSQWSDARLHFDVGPGLRSEAELGVLLNFFRARRGPARGFRLSDPFDFSSSAMTGTPTSTDQHIGTGDGLTATFQLGKNYGSGDDPQWRPITRPRADTLLVSIDHAATTDWTLGTGGTIIFTHAPPEGADIRAGFLFDVPVRFAEDRLAITGATFAAGEAPSVPLVEIREAV